MTEQPPACEACPEAERCAWRGNWFECPGCGRRVPWCYGAADDAMPELCDGCWSDVRRAREEGLQNPLRQDTEFRNNTDS